MTGNRNNEDRQNTTNARAEGHGYSCPTWCRYPGACSGEHVGKAWGTTATGGLPPDVDGPEAPRHDTVVVCAQWPEIEDLPPGVAVFGVHADRDFQVDLTLREAGVLLAGLTAALATAKAAG